MADPVLLIGGGILALKALGARPVSSGGLPPEEQADALSGAPMSGGFDVIGAERELLEESQLAAPEIGAPAVRIGTPTARQVGGVLQVLGQIGSAISPQLGQLVTRLGSSIVARASQQAPAATAVPIGPLEATGTRSYALPTGGVAVSTVGEEIDRAYTPGDTEAGYETRDLEVEIQGGRGVGTVETAQGELSFDFDIPFPEVGF